VRSCELPIHKLSNCLKLHAQFRAPWANTFSHASADYYGLLSFRFLQIEALILEQEIPKSKKIVNEHLMKPEVLEASTGHRNSREENGVRTPPTQRDVLLSIGVLLREKGSTLFSLATMPHTQLQLG
jgi:hypothetical protein